MIPRKKNTDTAEKGNSSIVRNSNIPTRKSSTRLSNKGRYWSRTYRYSASKHTHATDEILPQQEQQNQEHHPPGSHPHSYPHIINNPLLKTAARKNRGKIEKQQREEVYQPPPSFHSPPPPTTDRAYQEEHDAPPTLCLAIGAYIHNASSCQMQQAFQEAYQLYHSKDPAVAVTADGEFRPKECEQQNKHIHKPQQQQPPLRKQIIVATPKSKSNPKRLQAAAAAAAHCDEMILEGCAHLLMTGPSNLDDDDTISTTTTTTSTAWNSILDDREEPGDKGSNEIKNQPAEAAVDARKNLQKLPLIVEQMDSSQEEEWSCIDDSRTATATNNNASQGSATRAGETTTTTTTTASVKNPEENREFQSPHKSSKEQEQQEAPTLGSVVREHTPIAERRTTKEDDNGIPKMKHFTQDNPIGGASSPNIPVPQQTSANYDDRAWCTTTATGADGQRDLFCGIGTSTTILVESVLEYFTMSVNIITKTPYIDAATKTEEKQNASTMLQEVTTDDGPATSVSTDNDSLVAKVCSTKKILQDCRTPSWKDHTPTAAAAVNHSEVSNNHKQQEELAPLHMAYSIGSKKSWELDPLYLKEFFQCVHDTTIQQEPPVHHQCKYLDDDDDDDDALPTGILEHDYSKIKIVHVDRSCHLHRVKADEREELLIVQSKNQVKKETDSPSWHAPPPDKDSTIINENHPLSLVLPDDMEKSHRSPLAGVLETAENRVAQDGRVQDGAPGAHSCDFCNKIDDHNHGDNNHNDNNDNNINKNKDENEEQQQHKGLDECKSMDPSWDPPQTQKEATIGETVNHFLHAIEQACKRSPLAKYTGEEKTQGLVVHDIQVIDSSPVDQSWAFSKNINNTNDKRDKQQPNGNLSCDSLEKISERSQLAMPAGEKFSEIRVFQLGKGKHGAPEDHKLQKELRQPPQMDNASITLAMAQDIFMCCVNVTMFLPVSYILCNRNETMGEEVVEPVGAQPVGAQEEAPTVLRSSLPKQRNRVWATRPTRLLSSRRPQRGKYGGVCLTVGSQKMREGLLGTIFGPVEHALLLARENEVVPLKCMSTRRRRQRGQERFHGAAMKKQAIPEKGACTSETSCNRGDVALLKHNSPTMSKAKKKTTVDKPPGVGISKNEKVPASRRPFRLLLRQVKASKSASVAAE